MFIRVGFRRMLLAAVAAALVAGCSGGMRSANPLPEQRPDVALTSSTMNNLYPKSVSPASFMFQPMPQTAILPASAMGNVADPTRTKSITGTSWTQLSGYSSKVAVAPDGSIWALSDQPTNSVNKYIWHDVNGKWTNISGLGASIAVGPTGTVYIVNGTSTGVDAYNGSSWTYLGAGARSIAAGADGSIYILSSTGIVNGNSAIWKYKAGAWTQAPGSGSLIQGSSDPGTYTVPGVGTIVPNGYFVLNASGAISYYSPGIGYVQFPGKSSGVAAVPGGLFELNYPASASGVGLSYFDYASTMSTVEPGIGLSLASGPGSAGTGTQLAEVNSANLVYTTPITSLPSAPSVAFNDYVTFGYDNAHDVYNPNSTAITPTSIANLHLAWQTALDNGSDFSTQAQPILATEISGHSGVLFVAGSSGNVYAYDATSGALIWTRNFGQLRYYCGATYVGTLGVGGTVAYDPATKSLYVIGNANSAIGSYGQNTLYHVDAATGTVLGSVNVAGTAAGPTELDLAHTSVTVANGIAYVGTGSFCDISSWRGRVVAVDVPAMTLANTFFTLWDPRNIRGQGAQPWGGGGIWGWGGVSIDPNGNVLTAVGNGDAGGNYGTIAAPFVVAPTEYSGYAESVLELDSSLSTVVASNHPVPLSFYASAGDVDEQGTPVVFTPTGCGTMLAVQGKAGQLTLYDETAIATGPVAQFQMGPASGTDYFIGEPAYSPATGLLYSDVAASAAPSLFSPGLVAVNPGCGTPSVVWKAAFGSASDAPRGVPAVSAGGVVFAGSGGTVWALNASTGTILNSGQPLLHTGGAMRMPVTIDGNWVFVIDNNGNLYGLTTDARFPTVQATLRKPTGRQRTPTWVEKQTRNG